MCAIYSTPTVPYDQMFLFCLHGRIWRDEHPKRITWKQSTLAASFVHTRSSSPSLHSCLCSLFILTRAACGNVRPRLRLKRSQTQRQNHHQIQTEGCLLVVCFSSDESVGFELSPVIVVICMLVHIPTKPTNRIAILCIDSSNSIWRKKIIGTVNLKSLFLWQRNIQAKLTIDDSLLFTFECIDCRCFRGKNIKCIG